MADRILYRVYDANDELLYIGISISLLNRLTSHRKDASWWDDATVIRLQRYPDWESLADAEAVAIQTERPRHNLVYAHGRPRRARKPRQKGTGCISQRANGLWVASVEDTPSPQGKRRRKAVYGKDRATVEAKLAALLATHKRSMVYGGPEI